MTTYIAHPKDKAQATALKAILKALKVPFETEPEAGPKSIYSDEFNEKMRKSNKNYAEGKFEAIKVEDLWK